jgi:hypothetical protein
LPEIVCQYKQKWCIGAILSLKSSKIILFLTIDLLNLKSI